jgi:hypothetical protein
MLLTTVDAGAVIDEENRVRIAKNWMKKVPVDVTAHTKLGEKHEKEFKKLVAMKPFDKRKTEKLRARTLLQGRTKKLGNEFIKNMKESSRNVKVTPVDPATIVPTQLDYWNVQEEFDASLVSRNLPVASASQPILEAFWVNEARKRFATEHTHRFRKEG